MSERLPLIICVVCRNSIPIASNGLESSFIYNTKLPHLIQIIRYASRYDHLFFAINVQTQTVCFINDPFAFLKVHFNLNLTHLKATMTSKRLEMKGVKSWLCSFFYRIVSPEHFVFLEAIFHFARIKPYDFVGSSWPAAGLKSFTNLMLQR